MSNGAVARKEVETTGNAKRVEKREGCVTVSFQRGETVTTNEYDEVAVYTGKKKSQLSKHSRHRVSCVVVSRLTNLLPCPGLRPLQNSFLTNIDSFDIQISLIEHPCRPTFVSTVSLLVDRRTCLRFRDYIRLPTSSNQCSIDLSMFDLARRISRDSPGQCAKHF